MMLINGKESESVHVLDRGLAYGDGLFETIAIINQKPHNWLLHFKRLKDSCERLLIPSPNEKELLSDLKILVLENKDTRFIVKIIITRGLGERGYCLPSICGINRFSLSSPWPVFSDVFYTQGVNLSEVSLRVSQQPLLAGIKHLNRLEQVLAQAELDKINIVEHGLSYQEGLLCDSNNYLISAISANIYFVKNDILCLPKLKQSGVDGTVRQQIINYCLQYNILYQIDEYLLSELDDASEVFMSNSVRGLWPVKLVYLLSGDSLKFKLGKIYHQLAIKINQELGY